MSICGCLQTPNGGDSRLSSLYTATNEINDRRRQPILSFLFWRQSSSWLNTRAAVFNPTPPVISLCDMTLTNRLKKRNQSDSALAQHELSHESQHHHYEPEHNSHQDGDKGDRKKKETKKQVSHPSISLTGLLDRANYAFTLPEWATLLCYASLHIPSGPDS